MAKKLDIKRAKITIQVETDENTKIFEFHDVYDAVFSHDPHILDPHAHPQVGGFHLTMLPHLTPEGIYLTEYDKHLMGEEAWAALKKE